MLEGYGQTECTTACAFNRPHRYRIGTVGPAMPHVELRIGEDGEIETRGPHVFAGYHNDPEATAAVLVDGWLHTGDVGEIDEDGFLRITDRKRDLITTTTGKTIAPQRVEGRLKARPGISQALVLGDARPFLIALVTADESLAGRPGDEVRRAVEVEVAAVNETLAHGEQIRRFAVLDVDFTPAGGELTPTLKVRRRLVEERHTEADRRGSTTARRRRRERIRPASLAPSRAARRVIERPRGACIRDVLRRVAVGAVLTVALIAAVSSAAAGPADDAEQQRAVLEDLQAGEEQALVDLFAADSALGRAEERAQRLEERLAGVRDRVDETQRSLEISQSNLLVARKLLNERIEQWYRMDEIDAIEIILGSDSLSDVIDQFDAIERMSSRDADVVRGTRDFAAETKDRRRSLQDQEQQVEQLVAAARAEADRLAAARATKEALVADLRRQASLTSSRIERLDQAAQEAAARAEAIQAEQAASAGGSPTVDPGALGRRRQRRGGRRRRDGHAAARRRHAPARRERRPADHRLRDGVLHPRHDGERPAHGLRRVRDRPERDPDGHALLGARLRHVRGRRHGLGHHRQHDRRVVPRASQAQAWGRQSVTVTILG